MKRKPCPGALRIQLELAVDIAQRWFDRTRSRRAYAALFDDRDEGAGGMSGCACYRCTEEKVAAAPDPTPSAWGDARMMRMFLCATCGNKRCPHATDHRLACTASNEPGQPGSSYA